MPKKARIPDEIFMKRSLELAVKGCGFVSPNPMVGCVIVKNGKIIAEGYHKKFGQFHAERIAINSAISKGINIKGSTVYVNLEPCSHFGKTPPCTSAIIEHKIKRVVMGTIDPNPLISGKGIAALKKNNIEVTHGILEDECRELNRFFFKYIKTGLPYVTLKAAQTLDGKIADINYRSKWISSLESRKLVHEWRSEYDAVLIGKKTLECDNPSLTARLVKGRNPYRIIIDNELTPDLSYNLYSDKFTNKTIIITSKDPDTALMKILTKRRIRIIKAKIKDDKIILKDALKKLAKIGIASIMVEGGAYTFSEFINQRAADQLTIFTAPMIMGPGIETFRYIHHKKFENAKKVTCEKISSDILINIYL
ncbi:MAG: bifunctional diaminohydroxyphosphoribosylaminopyrimidine deaminase/5-amino-6-(5-phosphoribosylamino)uracil reductase RibD [Ignavibacteriae bacterium]|nr:MAG: bifunctional diaminohydroxyphosphoribosylaminopyrimidine deaminase/5-amino-6-(5-phosphoribosylamino)uracil reductase RibD [Ignavibacteriota bacterium]